MEKPRKSKLRVVVDANILVAGITWPRFPYEVLRHAAHGDYQLVLSSRIIQEAHAALAEIAPSRQGALDDLLRAADCEVVPPPEEAQIQAASNLVRDPKDIHVALAAINADVDCLVTQDRDFTDRVKSTEELHKRLTIILPATFLREYMGWSSEDLEAIRNRTWRDLEP